MGGLQMLKQTHRLAQRSKGASMITQWMRGGGNQAQGRKKYIDRFKLSLERGIDSVHEFSCTRNAFCVHVTCTVVTLHAICEGLDRLIWKFY